MTNKIYKFEGFVSIAPEIEEKFEIEFSAEDMMKVLAIDPADYADWIAHSDFGPNIQSLKQVA